MAVINFDICISPFCYNYKRSDVPKKGHPIKIIYVFLVKFVFNIIFNL